MKRYKFMGHYVGEPEPREIPEHIIRGFYASLVLDHRAEHGELSYDELSFNEFCETICDPHESIANSKGDFWAERAA